MSIYHDYARLYDRSGQLGFSLRMIHYLEELLAIYPVKGQSMLDLACGTGTVAIALAAKGWQVQGVDGSAEMLHQAEEKTPPDVNIRWSQQDMRSFTSAEPVSLVTCLYDSLNYLLTNDDLLSAFRHVHTALQPGGLFVFDMNTAWTLAVHWDDVTYVTDTEDLTTIMQSTYDDHRQRATVTLICFERQGDHFTKVRERHVEQAFPLEQVATHLANAGFKMEAQYVCFTLRAANDQDERVLWVARKLGVDDHTSL
ncbi:MAG: class I SAM-dependent DNA methyltransferase [Anaerolineae bacterium]